jgi:hypothetical protein
MLPPEWAYLGEGTAHTVAEGVWVFANALTAMLGVWRITGKAARVVLAADRLRIAGVAAVPLIRGVLDLNVDKSE